MNRASATLLGFAVAALVGVVALHPLERSEPPAWLTQTCADVAVC